MAFATYYCPYPTPSPANGFSVFAIRLAHSFFFVFFKNPNTSCPLYFSPGLVYIDDRQRNQLVGVGETARFVCQTAIHPADAQEVIVVWTHDDSPVNLTRHNKYSYQRRGNQHILLVEHTEYGDSGDYSCQATAGTVADVSTAHLTVLGKLTVDHTHTHTRTRARTRTHTHTHTC